MARTNKSVPEKTCSDENRKAIAEILDRLGDKWTIMIVGELFYGPLRYSELQRRVGVVSQRMLTLSLKGLVSDGLITRTVYPTNPPQVAYCLTERGLGLHKALQPLWNWAIVNAPSVLRSLTSTK